MRRLRFWGLQTQFVGVLGQTHEDQAGMVGIESECLSEEVWYLLTLYRST